MHQTILCNWLMKGALAVAVVVGGASSAFAGWGHHGWGGSSGGSWGGSSGGWGSSGGSSGGWGSSGGYYYGGSSGGSSGGWGRGGLFHHHRRWGGSSGGWGSSGGYYGGSSGGWGSSGGYYNGGSSGGWGSSGGSSGGAVYGGGYYSPSVVVPEGEYYGPAKSAPPANIPPADGSPAAPPPAGEAPPPAPAPGGSTSINRADGMLIVEVPADAKIYVNGRLTSTPGEIREYVSRNLTRGYNYAYEVRAEVERDGQIVTDTKRIDLRAGESTKLAFNLAPSADVETAITVKVPANAKVSLGGNETNLQGETRVFRTSALKAGSEWKNYTIVATLEVDGREITKEQSIDVKAGENQEVAFDFDTTSVAAR